MYVNNRSNSFMMISLLSTLNRLNPNFNYLFVVYYNNQTETIHFPKPENPETCGACRTTFATSQHNNVMSNVLVISTERRKKCQQRKKWKFSAIDANEKKSEHEDFLLTWCHMKDNEGDNFSCCRLVDVIGDTCDLQFKNGINCVNLSSIVFHAFKYFCFKA